MPLPWHCSPQGTQGQGRNEDIDKYNEDGDDADGVYGDDDDHSEDVDIDDRPNTGSSPQGPQGRMEGERIAANL